MNTLISIDKTLTRLLEYLLVTLFAIFLFLVCLLVVMRYGFSTSILGGNELVTICFLYTSAIGGAVGITKKEHIAITFFIDLLPHAIKKWIHILGLFLIAVVNGYMIYYTMNWIEKAGHFPWQPFNLPQVFVHVAIPIGCGLAIFFCFFRILLTLNGRENLDSLWLPEE